MKSSCCQSHGSEVFLMLLLWIYLCLNDCSVIFPLVDILYENVKIFIYKSEKAISSLKCRDYIRTVFNNLLLSKAFGFRFLCFLLMKFIWINWLVCRFLLIHLLPSDYSLGLDKSFRVKCSVFLFLIGSYLWSYCILPIINFKELASWRPQNPTRDSIFSFSMTRPPSRLWSVS